MYPSPSPSPAPSPPAYLYLNSHHHQSGNHAGGPGGQGSGQNSSGLNTASYGHNSALTPVARFPVSAGAWPTRGQQHHPHHSHQQNPSMSSLPGSIGHSSAASGRPSSPGGYGNLAHHHHHHSGHGPSGLSHLASPATLHSDHMGSPSSTNAAAAAAAAAAAGSPHWQQQILKAEISRRSAEPHHHARAAALAARSATNSAITITDPNKGVVLPQVAANGLFVPKKEGSANGTAAEDKGSGADAATGTAAKDKQTWSTVDMGGLSLKNIANEVYRYSFLTSLFINHNALTTISSDIVKLRHLTVLDASGNQLTSVPSELGMLTSLRELFLFDNNLVNLPAELGTLYQLEMLGIEGNPLTDQLRTLFQRDGTQAVIAYLRDSCPVPLPPPEREWILIDPDLPEPQASKDNPESPELTFNALSYNILCEKYATAQMYGYTPSWALTWDYRKEFILQEVMSYSADFCCLQEIDMEQYEDYFCHHLSQQDYEGIYWPKSRARTMRDEEKRRVDGCAIFYKSNKYQLIEKQLVEFSQIALQRPDFKKSEDMYNRVMTKDNIAVIALLEHRDSGSRVIVVNVHTHWDPQFRDVKLVQVAMLMDEVEKAGSRFAKLPPKLTVGEGYPPAPKYTHASQIPTIICGDFNSVPETGVYDFLTNGAVPGDHEDFMDHVYGNYTANGLQHCHTLDSAYAPIGEMPFTNYTPGYEGAIDYIFYSKNTLAVTGVLGEIDKGYLSNVVGFPNAHFPSDHICILSEFKLKHGSQREGSANQQQHKARTVDHGRK